MRKKKNQSILGITLLSVVVMTLALACMNGHRQEGDSANVEIQAENAVSKKGKTGYDGIDISHHNGKIDWSRVAKDTNVKFVYIKATEGATWQDNHYKAYFKQARKNNLKVGSYHYFRMTSTPQEQFANFKNTVVQSKQDLIPMVDVELYKNKKGFHMDKHYISNKKQRKKIIDNLREFLTLVEKEYGCKPMLYCTPASYNHVIKGNFKGYKLYVGRYCNGTCSGPGVADWTIWQYSERGKVAGMRKSVDVARFSPTSSLKDITMPDKKEHTSATKSKVLETALFIFDNLHIARI